jgi:EpsI family protein
MMNRLALFVPVLVLGVGSAAISGIRQQFAMTPVRPIAGIPAEVSTLERKDIPIADEERKVAGMSDYVLTEYRVDSISSFSIYVGYYDRQVQGKSIHSPKNCLPGAGWEILDASKVSIRSNSDKPDVNRVILSNRGTRALVYYWYQGRGRIQSSEYRVKWDLLRDAALYGRTEEALVRIVVPIAPIDKRQLGNTDSGVQKADSLARAIAEPLARSVSLALPSSPRA